MGAEAVDRAVVEIPRHHAANGAVIDDQVEREILDEEIDLMLDALAVERVQDGVTGAVGGGSRALRNALAVVARHAAKGALVDLAFLGARERDAEMLEFVDRVRGVAAEVLDGILVAEPVRPFHRVVHVPAPVVLAHIAERGRDAALGCDGVTAGREDLCDAGCLEAAGCAFERGAQARAAGPHDNDVEGVIGNRIGGGHQMTILSSEMMQAPAIASAKARLNSSNAILAPGDGT